MKCTFPISTDAFIRQCFIAFVKRDFAATKIDKPSAHMLF